MIGERGPPSAGGRSACSRSSASSRRGQRRADALAAALLSRSGRPSPGATGRYAPGGNVAGSGSPAPGGGGAETPSPSPGGSVGMGDLRSRLVRERSRCSSSAFGSSSGVHRRPSGRGVVPAGPAPAGLRGSHREGRGGTPPPVGTADDAADLLSSLAGGPVPPLFASMCHGGLEVLFAAVNSDEEPPYLLAVHARTRAPFQKLVVGRGGGGSRNGRGRDGSGGEVVALSCHPSSGHVYAATDGGDVVSFRPVRADPMRVAYGRYRWVPGRTARAGKAFGGPDGDPSGAVFGRGGDGAESARNLSSSTAGSLPCDYPLDESGQPPLPSSPSPPARGVVLRPSMSPSRVLVAHGDTLAVYDFGPQASDHRFGNVHHAGDGKEEAEAVWTKRLEGCAVEHACLSGDGRAVAVALRGEGVGVPYPFGVRTFVRRAEDGVDGKAGEEAAGDGDGTAGGSHGRPPLVRSRSSAGMGPTDVAPPLPGGAVAADRGDGGADAGEGGDDNREEYVPGPFLVHSAPPTRLSFRGQGTRTSSLSHLPGSQDDGTGPEGEGNDLLLTSSGDCTVRIFGQSSWRQLMSWTTPPDTRAGWVAGISAGNLGDLDGNPSSSAGGDGSEGDAGGAGDPAGTGSDALLSPGRVHPGPSAPGAPSHHHPASAPTTHAGAWIAEVTSRGSCPALRLSRLSYVRSGGDDATPAHFESVAAILPPGSLDGAVTAGDGTGSVDLSVEGVWPVWDREEGRHGAGGLAGPAGRGANGGQQQQSSFPLSSTAPRWVSDGSDLGGSHAPPSELRITSTSGRHVVQMEMPLWGDRDLGAMEFGSPLRHVMALPGPREGLEERVYRSTLPPVRPGLASATLDHEGGSKVVARWRPAGSEGAGGGDGRASEIELVWHRVGAVNLEEVPDGLHGRRRGKEGGRRRRTFRDVGLTPLPLVLPPLTLPPSPPRTGGPGGGPAGSGPRPSVSSLHWWPDDNFGGPPRLAALTSDGSLVVYEMPPPRFALEPPMPAYDPFADDASRSSDDSDAYEAGMREVADDEVLPPALSGSGHGGSSSGRLREEYEVNIMPHPDFGLGLRLEAQADGMPSIAGSFKKHPLSGGRLPAERSGVIALGDELLAVNGTDLSGRRFEDAIATVRRIGFESHNEPMRMRFRRCGSRRGSVASASERDERGVPTGVVSSPPPSRGSSASPRRRGGGGDASPAAAGTPGGSRSDAGAGAEEPEVQQGYGRVIAVVRDRFVPPRSPSSLTEAASASPVPLILVPWSFGKGAQVSHRMYGGALVLWAEGRDVRAARLEATLDADPEGARFIDLGSASLDGAVSSLSLVEPTDGGWLVCVHDSGGGVGLLFVETAAGPGGTSPAPTGNESLRADFRYYPSVLGPEASGGGYVSVKPHSMDLVGGIDRGGRSVTVWTALPQSVAQSFGDEGAPPLDYCSARVPIDDDVLDFRWISSGFVDAFPWLAVSTKRSIEVFHRNGAETAWSNIASFRRSEMSFGPIPHLTAALRSIVLPSDETSTLRADWSPDSILASICTEESGAKLALTSYVAGLFGWLSQWMNDNGDLRPRWNCHGPLCDAPFRVVNDDTIVMTDNESETAVESSASMFASMSLGVADKTNTPSEEEVLLSDLQRSLCPRDATAKTKAQASVAAPARSREFMLAMSQGSNLDESTDPGKKKALPTPLQSLSQGEISCLWAIGEVLTTSFKNLDVSSQLCLFCVCLMRKLADAQDSSSDDDVEQVQSMPSYQGGRPVLLPASSSGNLVKGKVEVGVVASAAILSALMSDSQPKLIDACRPADEKYDWASARAIGLPYWVRSDKALASVAEEIAQTIYKSTKNVMDCALYYIAMRNMKKLRAIAATDRSLSGKKFLKFIMDHDFSSDRGRKAAEKNAYSLLRKRKYAHAASFFLLAEPPMIKTAIDVITMQLQDPSLAFMVARLVESTPKSSASSSNGDALTIGGGFSLSSMGGGGGFAGPGFSSEFSTSREEDSKVVKFDRWSPKLSKSSRLVLKPSQSNRDDVCFDAIQLLWLGRPNEAKIRLSFCTPPKPGLKNEISLVDLPLPPCFSSESVEETTLVQKANQIINLSSSPFLLKRLKPKKRVLWSSALQVSRALSHCGIEIPSIRILHQAADPEYIEETCVGVPPEKEEESLGRKSAAPSSTFDSKPKPSSIFDSYDAPVQKPKPQPDPMASSSIFAGFDAAPAKPQPQPAVDTMTSSIFDSFDAAPPKPKPKPPSQPAADPMSSSIFDSFDAPPPKPKPKPPSQPAADPMSSSIFDSFDAPPPKPKPQSKPQPVTDTMASSSIFDSFDAAPQRHKTQPKSQPADDPMAASSSIFDSFDAAPQRPKSQAKPQPSIFNSFDAAPPKRPPTGGGPKTSKSQDDGPEEVEKEQPFHISDCPAFWNEWRERLILNVASRRLLREMARIVSSFDGDIHYHSMEEFADRNHPLISSEAATVLHKACDGHGLLDSVYFSLTDLASAFVVEESAILEQALVLLSSSEQPKRVVFSVLIHCLLGRGDLAEDIVRDAASYPMLASEYLGLSNEIIVETRDTQHYKTSLWSRREVSSMIWQLELALWLCRGGAFDMSSTGLKETLLAVRVGLAAAAWGRCHQSLDTLVKAAPDCQMDFEAGKNLWRSMKIIVVHQAATDGVDGVTSGGWEFLVDCRREEATEMLRDGKTGQFLIRPHPQDPGVFTLSFKTNLVPTELTPTANYDESSSSSPEKTLESKEPTAKTDKPKKVIKRDDVVQHAIIRLSDSGFRCGSFGPFAALIKLLHKVSESLPFDLRFSDPPVKGIINEQGTQTSPNAFLFRKMALHSKQEHFRFNGSAGVTASPIDHGPIDEDAFVQGSLQRKFGLFSQLLVLSELRKQLCAVASAITDEETEIQAILKSDLDLPMDDDFDDGSLSEGSLVADDEEFVGAASRMVKPLLNWVRSREIHIVEEISPHISHLEPRTPVDPAGTSEDQEQSFTCGDAMVRKMIQSGSGVEFRTLRVGEAGNSVIVVLFSKQDAIKWLMAQNPATDEDEANDKLKLMEDMRIIEPITSSDLSIPKSYAATHPSTESRYRFVDPWEVEALESRNGETASAALGRGRYLSLNVGLIANSCEKIVREAGGLHLLSLWSTLKGGIALTKALCSAHPTWERDSGGDLLMRRGFLMEPSPYDNSIRQHLYGNYLFRRLGLPQRFLALVQVELLDLKNVTSPSGASALTAYALLRLKRQGSTAPLNHRARSLDSASTRPIKISKSSGPHAPASWGSLVRFRFPLPEGVNCEGRCYDSDREALFKGPPTCLQISVYERKFMSDVELGGADVNLDALGSGGQIEEWVPLRAGKDGITWFARIRISLRFELLILDSDIEAVKDDKCPSVGLRKLAMLSRLGAHEDTAKAKGSTSMANSMSTPDLVGYFGLGSTLGLT